MTSRLGKPWRIVHGLATDVRLSVRSLARTRGFTLVALLSLALGIGANAALFSFVHAVFFRPVPGVSQPDGIVELPRPLGRCCSGSARSTLSRSG